VPAATGNGTAGAAGTGGTGGGSPAPDPGGTNAPATLDAGTSDAKGAADAGPAATIKVPPGFSPGALANVVLWLDAAKNVTEAGGKVSKWADLSANHSDAAQTSAAKQPTLREGAINKLPAIHFERARKTGLLIADAPTLNFGKGDFTVIIVGDYTNKAGIHLDGFAYFFHKQAKVAVDNRPEPAEVIIAGNWPNGDTVPMVTKLTLSLNAHMVKAHSKDQGYNDGMFRVIAGNRTGTKISIRVNGELAGTSSSDWNVDSVGQPAAIGATAGGGYPVDGDIAEVIVIKGGLPAMDLAVLETYLKDKYGLK
jgi:hypothetical protein